MYPFKDAAIIVMGIEVGAVGTTDGVGTVVKVTIGEQTQNRGWYYDQVTKRLYNQHPHFLSGHLPHLVSCSCISVVCVSRSGLSLELLQFT